MKCNNTTRARPALGEHFSSHRRANAAVPVACGYTLKSVGTDSVSPIPCARSEKFGTRMKTVMKYRTIIVILVLTAVLAYVYVDRNRRIDILHRAADAAASAEQSAVSEMHTLRRSQSHYMHLYNMYAATERHRQYGDVADNVAIFYGRQRDFVPIEDVTEKIVCPKPVKKLPDGFTFYGFRNIVLNRTGQLPLFYSMSYQGNHGFIRDRDEFDSLIDLGNPGPGRIVRLTQSQAANLLATAPKPLTRTGKLCHPILVQHRRRRRRRDRRLLLWRASLSVGERSLQADRR